MKCKKQIPTRTYEEVRHVIRSGDLLSFHPTPCWYKPWTFWTWLIAFTNKYRICHSAMAVWIGDNLLCAQMQACPNRVILLSSLVKKYPGAIIVSRALVGRGFKRKAAASRMIALTALPYNKALIWFLGFTNTFTGGWLYPNNPNAVDDLDSPAWPCMCSEAYSRAMRLGGFDAVPDRIDSRTEPHHLFTSPKMKTLFTLE